MLFAGAAYLASVATASALWVPTRVPMRASAAMSADASPELEEVWLSPAARTFRKNMAESIQKSDVVFCMPQVASEDELGVLLADAIAACDKQSQWSADGKNRFCVADPVAFEQDTVFRCEELMLRVLDRLDEQLPCIYDTLFKPSDEWTSRQPLQANGQARSVGPPSYLAETCPTLRDLYMAGELEWSEGEPAINVYTEQGGFGTHKDHMALTVLLPLTTGFEGGGTGFWSAQDELAFGDGSPAGPPTKVIRPPLGTALIFGGDISHAGMPVQSGLRSVFVCSFTTRTDASPADRVQGLQGGGQAASALRERNEATRERVDEPIGLPAPSASAEVAPAAPPAASTSAPPSAKLPRVRAAGRRKKGSAKERMRQLDELLEMEMISAEEHAQKRAEVLANI